jgi:hypothetical protein
MTASVPAGRPTPGGVIVKTANRLPERQRRRAVPSVSGTNGHARAPARPARRPVVTVTDRDNGHPAPSVPDAGGRDQGGRFAKGNKGGPGNPFFRASAERRRAFLSAITPEEIGQVARKMLAQALAGDAASAKLLLLYSIGKPLPAGDPDHAELDELRLMLLRPLALQIILHGLEAVNPDEALAFLKAAADKRGGDVVGQLDKGKLALLEDARRAAVLGRAKDD